MRENGSYFDHRFVRLASSCILVTALVFAGCTRNDSKPTGANEITVPGVPFTQVPSDVYSAVSKPTLVLAGVNSSGVPDNTANCQFNVTVKDGSNVAIAGLDVVLDLYSYNFDGAIVCAVPSGVSIDDLNYPYGPQHIQLTATTDASGIAHFRAAGKYQHLVSCSYDPYNPEPTGKRGDIYYRDENEDLVLLFADKFGVATGDLDRANGVNGADYSLFLADYYCTANNGAQPYHWRTDYNSDGLINAADMSIFLSLQFSGGSTYSCQ